MQWPRRRLGPWTVLVLLWGAGALAQPAPSHERKEAPQRVTPDDDRRPGKSSPPLNPEDQEVIENLDLLENFESSEDLELLQELSREDDG